MIPEIILLNINGIVITINNNNIIISNYIIINMINVYVGVIILHSPHFKMKVLVIKCSILIS